MHGQRISRRAFAELWPRPSFYDTWPDPEPSAGAVVTVECLTTRQLLRLLGPVEAEIGDTYGEPPAEWVAPEIVYRERRAEQTAAGPAANHAPGTNDPNDPIVSLTAAPSAPPALLPVAA